MPKRIIVYGPEMGFDDYQLLDSVLTKYTFEMNKDEFIIMVLGNKGVAKYVSWWTYKSWGKYEVHHPDYFEHGLHGAVLEMNEAMVRNADVLIAFNDGDKYVKDMIQRAKKHELEIEIILC